MKGMESLNAVFNKAGIDGLLRNVHLSNTLSVLVRRVGRSCHCSYDLMSKYCQVVQNYLIQLFSESMFLKSI